MRRIADLHPGSAKTDARNTFSTANAASSLPHTSRPVGVGDDALAELEVLVAFDCGLAGEANRIRTMLTGVHPALECVIGPRIKHRASRAGPPPASCSNRRRVFSTSKVRASPGLLASRHDPDDVVALDHHVITAHG